MLKDLDLDHVGGRALVVGPDFLLPEAHPIERHRRQAAAHLRELLRVRETAAQALDHAGVAADVERRADVAERRGVTHLDSIARLEARRDGRIVSRELWLHA